MLRYWRICTMGFWLGATVFGGVTQAYPLIRERASELGPITAEEVDGLYALAVVMPAPTFLNLWGAVSLRAGGWVGALMGLVALALPSFLLVLLIPLAGLIPVLAAHSGGALQGAIWGTFGLLAAVSFDALRRLQTRAQLTIVVLSLGALLAGLHPTLLMLLIVFLSAARSLSRDERKAV
jgi:chromate transport protein ChrA